MRIAIAGKGGSGKTTIAATMARLLAREGRRVIAIDGDTSPNLAQCIGAVAGADDEVVALPGDLLVRREDAEGNPFSELAVPVEDVIDRYGISAPDGVRLLVMGKVEHAGRGCKCRAHAIAKNVIGELLAFDESHGEVVLVDMEAGLEHLSRGTTRHVDVLLAIAEPYYRSLETARRAYELARELGIARVRMVANKVNGEAEAEAIRAFAERHSLDLAGSVPFDEAVVAADLRGVPLLQAAGPDAPAVRAIRDLLDRLMGPDLREPVPVASPTPGAG